MYKKIVLWFLLILTCCIIFNFSAQKGNNSGDLTKTITKKVVNVINKINDAEIEKNTFDILHGIIRKLGHFSEFALLGIFSFLLARSYEFSMKKSIIMTLLFVFLYAISDEIHQLFVEARNGSFKDVTIDFIGGCVGTSIFYPIEKRKIK